MEPEMSLQHIQAEQALWAQRNFGADRPSYRALIGALEELGELAHAHLKGEQGIRGSVADHEAAKKDAIADVVIYLVDYCNIEGFDIQDLLNETWQRVRQRDWLADPVNGQG